MDVNVPLDMFLYTKRADGWADEKEMCFYDVLQTNGLRYIDRHGSLEKVMVGGWRLRSQFMVMKVSCAL